MPSLQIIKGDPQGAFVPLDGDRFVLGRNPECSIVIPVTSVSREHAQILRIQGKYYVEDMQSRNRTYVNNQAITARTPLRHNDCATYLIWSVFWGLSCRGIRLPENAS